MKATDALHQEARVVSSTNAIGSLSPKCQVPTTLKFEKVKSQCTTMRYDLHTPRLQQLYQHRCPVTSSAQGQDFRKHFALGSYELRNRLIKRLVLVAVTAIRLIQHCYNLIARHTLEKENALKISQLKY